MSVSDVLREVYASAPSGAGSRIINTLHIHGEGFTSLYLAHSYVPEILMGIEFEPCQMTLSTPAKAADGQQSLRFAIGLIDSRAQRIATQAVESGRMVHVTHRQFLAANRNSPARTPLTMVVTGGEFSGTTVSIEAQYFDMLNFAWPRERYTIEKAPGVKYL